MATTKTRPSTTTAKKVSSVRPQMTPTAAMIAQQHRRIHELAAAPRQVREAAIAESARLMAVAPHEVEESEFTVALGGDDFVD